MKQEKGLAYCGLVCAVCSENENCPGCRKEGCKDKEWCKNFICARQKHINGCWECEDFPCNAENEADPYSAMTNMLGKLRIRTFARFIRQYGEEKLLECLGANEKAGIMYHYPGELEGDYDKPKTENEIIELIFKNDPHPNLYVHCPVYETEDYLVRLVRMEDAEDLLSCYGDPKAQPIFNSDNCTNDFWFSTIEEMKDMIGYWIDSYSKGYYVRLSILDKKKLCEAVGTIELFNWDQGKPIPNVGVLRMDLASDQEQEGKIAQLLDLAVIKLCPALQVEHMITKAIPLAAERRKALQAAGFSDFNRPDVMDFGDYFCIDGEIVDRPCDK